MSLTGGNKSKVVRLMKVAGTVLVHDSTERCKLEPQLRAELADAKESVFAMFEAEKLKLEEKLKETQEQLLTVKEELAELEKPWLDPPAKQLRLPFEAAPTVATDEGEKSEAPPEEPVEEERERTGGELPAGKNDVIRYLLDAARAGHPEPVCVNIAYQQVLDLDWSVADVQRAFDVLVQRGQVEVKARGKLEVVENWSVLVPDPEGLTGDAAADRAELAEAYGHGPDCDDPMKNFIRLLACIMNHVGDGATEAGVLKDVKEIAGYGYLPDAKAADVEPALQTLVMMDAVRKQGKKLRHPNTGASSFRMNAWGDQTLRRCECKTWFVSTVDGSQVCDVCEVRAQSLAEAAAEPDLVRMAELAELAPAAESWMSRERDRLVELVRELGSKPKVLKALAAELGYTQKSMEADLWQPLVDAGRIVEKSRGKWAPAPEVATPEAIQAVMLEEIRKGEEALPVIWVRLQERYGVTGLQLSGWFEQLKRDEKIVWDEATLDWKVVEERELAEVGS